MKRLILLLILLGGLGAGYRVYRERGAAAALAGLKFRTATVDRGDVIEGVQANGTVQPVILVTVGSQVSGVVVTLTADWNSKVKKDQVLAELDPRKMTAQVAQDQASIAVAKANVDKTRALLFQAERDLARSVTLAARQLLGQSDLDAAVANRDSLKAQLDLSEATVKQSIANMDQDRVNLEYCKITSPVDGTIVQRAVDVGQTVAASFQTPTLFLIANDLTKVQVQATVPEADIGKIKKGQTARFTVDAHPDHVFTGEVSQVRIAATTVQNVVTYTVIVDADNPEALLFPGMTATVTFEIKRAKDALRVPSAALRLQPPAEILEKSAEAEVHARGDAGGDKTAAAGEAPAGEADKVAGGKDGSADRGARSDRGGHRDRAAGEKDAARDRSAASDKTAASEKDGASEKGGGDKVAASADRAHARGKDGAHRGQVLYIRTPEGLLRAVPVRAGITDGTVTEVKVREGSPVTEGLEVVTAVMHEEEDLGSNPFMPKMGGPGNRGGGGGRGGR